MTREDVKQTMLLAMSEHHSGNAQEALRIVDAQLAAIEADGVRLVPVEATMDMQHAVSVYHLPHSDTYGNYADLDIQSAARDIYVTMLAASPYANQEPGE